MGLIAIPRRKLYLGPVSTRGYAPNAAGDTGDYNSRSFHYARDTIHALKLAIPNWWLTIDAGTDTAIENSTGGTLTIKASIEYPAGTFYQVTFGGSASGTVADNSTLISDWRAVYIPKGAKFYVRQHLKHTVAVPYIDTTQSPFASVADGDACDGNATDETLSGTITDGNFHVLMAPAAILGMTARPTLGVIGDSRTTGAGEGSADSTGDGGEIARPLGGQLAYIGLGVSGERASNYIAGNARRTELLQYVTDVVLEYGINDNYSGGGNVSDATLQSRMASIAGLYPNKRVWITTMPPITAPFPSNGNEAARTANNDWRRGVPLGARGIFEIADVMETSRNSGVWKSTPSAYTSDGVHESIFGNQQIAIDAGHFSR